LRNHFGAACPLSALLADVSDICKVARNTFVILNMSIKCKMVITNMSPGLAKRVGARVLIASTSEVYGDPEVHPQPESYWGHVNPIGRRMSITYVLYFGAEVKLLVVN
jgi:hypothetical protein